MSGEVSGIRYLYNVEKVENTVRYAMAAAINHQAAPLNDIVRDYALFEVGKEGLVWFQENKGHRLKSLKDAFKYSPETYNVFKDAVKRNSFTNTVMETYRHRQLNNALRNLPKKPPVPGIVMTQKFKNAKAVSQQYKATRDLIEASKTLKGKELKNAVKAVNQSVAEAKYGVHLAKQSGLIKPTNTLGKVGRAVSKYSGKTFVKGKYLQLMAKSSAARTAAKVVKGNAAMVAFSVAMEAPEIIETYQVLGKERGNKQLKRTAINATAEVAGYIAGMKAGAIAGAAIGSCIPVPIVGTVVGTIVGIGCGLLGSWLAGKAIRKCTGPSELEQEKEKQAKEIAQEAIKNPEVLDEVLVAASERLAEEQENETKSPDYEDGYKAFVDVYNTKQKNEMIAQSTSSEETSDNEDTSQETSASHQQTSTTSSAQNEESSNNGTKRVKDKSLDRILTNLSQLIAENNSIGFNSGFSPYSGGYGGLGGFGSTSPYMFNPFMPGGFGMNFSNNFNLYPQFGYTA